MQPQAHLFQHLDTFEPDSTYIFVSQYKTPQPEAQMNDGEEKTLRLLLNRSDAFYSMCIFQVHRIQRFDRLLHFITFFMTFHDLCILWMVRAQAQRRLQAETWTVSLTSTGLERARAKRRTERLEFTANITQILVAYVNVPLLLACIFALCFNLPVWGEAGVDYILRLSGALGERWHNWPRAAPWIFWLAVSLRLPTALLLIVWFLNIEQVPPTGVARAPMQLNV
jgi:hypothetical protein